MTIPEKIARLVAERGLNQETFAQLAGLNRNTVRQILTQPAKRLHNQTIRRCADALGLPVTDLAELPLEKLIPRVRKAEQLNSRGITHLPDQPALQHWIETHPERAATFSAEELNELASLQGVGGPLTLAGLEYHLEIIERKRKIKEQVDVIAGTEYLDLVEQVVALIHDKVQPYGDRR